MSLRRSHPSAAHSPPAKRAKIIASSRPNGLEAIIPKDGQGLPKKLTAKPTIATKEQKNNVDESNTAVGRGVNGDPTDIISIPSDHSSDEDSAEETDVRQQNTPLSNGTHRAQDFSSESSSDGEDDEAVVVNGDHEEADVEAGAAAPEEPSFGEILAANALDPIDVEAAFVDPDAAPLTATAQTFKRQRDITVPTAASLGTVLTQALKTNDRQLLESCFELADLDAVRSTIKRLPTSLVDRLLQRVAEKVHKRPGRWENMMIWMQWTIVCHGGYLATNRKLTKRLEAVDRVLKDRSGGFRPLLQLKGKLDMLSAQLDLRRDYMQRSAIEANDDEPAVIYVEGQTEAESEGDEEVQKIQNWQRGVSTPTSEVLGRRRNQKAQQEVDGAESSVDESDNMPTTNGMAAEEEEDEEEDEDEDMLDDEAEETENDTGDDMSSPDEFEDFIDDGEDGESGDDSDEPSERPMKKVR